MEDNSRETCSERWLGTVSALTIVLCLIIKFLSMGWGTIFLFPFTYLPVLVIHAKVQAAAFNPSETNGRGLITLIYASNLFLLAAFLVQVDAGDGQTFMAIYAVLHAFGMSSQSPFRLGDGWYTFNFLAFVPVAITWGLMPTHKRDNRPENETE
jgi:hypothetical protein